VLRKAGSVNYALGILNTASRLYKVAHEYRGIEGEDKGWDPTRAATVKMEAPNTRENFLRLEDLRKAWAATDQLMSPWWRDLWRVYLLTGLRDRLVMDMRFDQIDFERGLYLIEPLARGAKRRRKKLSQEERRKPIEMPLSSYVLSILKKRQEFAPKGVAGEWVWYSTETTRRKTKDLPRLTDPRSSWQRITPVIGYWCYKHDLRRTFASLGATVDPAAVLALSLLMMHSSKTVAKALGVPQITVDYIKGQQRAMRALTEKVSRAVLELVGETPATELTAGIREYLPLPEEIDRFLTLEEKAPTRGEEFAEEA
jgi:integrase